MCAIVACVWCAVKIDSFECDGTPFLVGSCRVWTMCAYSDGTSIMNTAMRVRRAKTMAKGDDDDDGMAAELTQTMDEKVFPKSGKLVKRVQHALDELITCAVCLDERLTIALCPCGHLACSTCAPLLEVRAGGAIGERAARHARARGFRTRAFVCDVIDANIDWHRADVPHLPCGGR